MRCSLTDSAAPDNPRCDARPCHSKVLLMSRETESRILTDGSPVHSGIGRPTKRHESAAVLREKSGQRRTGAAQSVLERRPLQAPASTQKKNGHKPPAHGARCELTNKNPFPRHVRLRIRRANTPGFILNTTPPTHTHTPPRRSGAQRAAGRICLLPKPSDSFSGVRCRQDPLTPHTVIPPTNIHRYLLVTGFTRRPIESTRPQVCHHIHF